GDQPELAEPVELSRGLRWHPGERIEVVDLRGDVAPERARVEPVDRLDRGPGRAEPGPERLATGPDRGDDPDARDPDPTEPRHDERFVVASSSDSRPSSASAMARNVPSVRPAMGRVKNRSTNAANNGIAGRKSWSMATRAPRPPGPGSMRQVT